MTLRGYLLLVLLWSIPCIVQASANMEAPATLGKKAKKLKLPPLLGKKRGAFHYGSSFKLSALSTLHEIKPNLGKFANQPVKLYGDITDVCQNKGCWLIFKQGDHSLRVKFKDYGFFVPKDATGRKIIIEGTVQEETLSEEMARHLAEEGKKPAEDITAIKGPQKILSFIATGVEIR